MKEARQKLFRDYALTAFLLAALVVLLPNGKAQAQCCASVPGQFAGVVTGLHAELVAFIAAQHAATIAIVGGGVAAEFEAHRSGFMEGIFYGQIIKGGLQDMHNEGMSLAFRQAMMAGSFLDATEQLETQRLLNKLAAEAQRDYNPSGTINPALSGGGHPAGTVCHFGSAMKAFPSARQNADLNQIALSKWNIKRNIGGLGTAGAASPADEFLANLYKFRKHYCVFADNNKELEELCKGNGGAGWFSGHGGFPRDPNGDIDFVNTFEKYYTLDIDFTDGGTATPDEENISSLAANLYGNRVLDRSAEDMEPDAADNDNPTKFHQRHLWQRSVIAKRSVAANSFFAMAGMKAKSGPNGGRAIRLLLRRMKLPEEEIDRLIRDGSAQGEGTQEDAPSYYAMMEVLTKKLYQDPVFYSNLVDIPANVMRQNAAMESFGLMQERDIYESIQRSEILLSLLLESEIALKQGKVGGNLTGSEVSGGRK